MGLEEKSGYVRTGRTGRDKLILKNELIEYWTVDTV